MKIFDFIQDVKNKSLDIVEHTYKVLEEAKKINKEYNYFNTISEELAIEQAKAVQKAPRGKLAGLPVSVKDCICVKSVESTAGSKILKNYKPVFNATAVQRAIDEGAIIIGKTAQDEFGFGSFSCNVGIDFKIPLNPFDKNRVCGGSSGGAAGITQLAKFPHIALAESTGGSIVNPASFCGVIGLCPTYGLVSRYGLIDYADSLDKIGVMAKEIEDVDLMLNVIKGNDRKDATSLKQDTNKDKTIKKVALIKESLDVDKEIKEIILSNLDNLKIKYEKISLPLTAKYGIPCYYIIAMSEASTNLARYCGIKYGLHEELKGNFDEYFSNVRSKGFGEETKRRIILGTFARMAGYRDKYYSKAMQVRTLIIQEYKKAFSKYDLLVSPTMPIIAPKFFDAAKLTPLQNYMMDTLTVGPNLAGLPHITLNASLLQKMPVGIMFIANHLDENKLIAVGEKLR
ncbi:MAG: amidase family protein [Nanoarchaeota archaeon]